MANQFYTTTLEKFLDASLGDLTSVVVKVHLIDGDDYVYSAAHDFENDITDAGIVATATINVTSAVGGALDADNTTFSAVSGDVCEELVVWVDTGGGDTTDPLICDIDTFSAGMPVTPNGGDITVAWASGTILSINQA